MIALANAGHRQYRCYIAWRCCRRTNPAPARMRERMEDRWRTGPVFARFIPTVKANFERRIGKWKDKRKKQLFGGTAPDRMFLN